MTIFRRLLFLVVLLGCAAPALGYGYPKPKNWRKLKKKPAAAATAEPPPGPDIGSGWSAKARQALDELLAVRGSSAPAYNAQVPPVAVIGYDGLGADGDAAEAVFYRLVTEVEFKLSDDFWRQVPIAYGRQRLRADYEAFSPLDKKLWPLQPEYRDFRKGFLSSYQRVCSLVGTRECRSYLASLLIGFTPDEARDYAKNALAEEAKQKPRVEAIGDSDDDPRPVRWRRGFAPRQQVARLIAALRAAGFDVWVIGMDAQPVLLAASADLGVDSSRCLGIFQHTEHSRFNGRPKEPIPIRVGAVDALVNAVGRRPTLAVAASASFADLLLYADGLRVVVGDDAELAKLLAGGAVVQPAFKAPRP